MKNIFSRKSKAISAADKLANIRFAKEIIPFEDVIAPLIEECEEELHGSVLKDYQQIREQFLSDSMPVRKGEQKLYLATAKPPAAGGSTELDLEIEEGMNPESTNYDARYTELVMADPDRYGLEYMNYTYRPMLSAGIQAKLGYKEAKIESYNRSRPGSNIIASSIINEGVTTGRHIAHGTTMTGGGSEGLLRQLGEEDYERRLMVVFTPEQMRIAAADKRANKEANYQVDPSDFSEKGKKFFERIPVYFEHGDHLKLYWKDNVEKRAILAAELKGGEFIAHDIPAVRQLVTQYALWRLDKMEQGSDLANETGEYNESADIPKFSELIKRYKQRGNNNEINGYAFSANAGANVGAGDGKRPFLTRGWRGMILR